MPVRTSPYYLKELISKCNLFNQTATEINNRMQNLSNNHFHRLFFDISISSYFCFKFMADQAHLQKRIRKRRREKEVENDDIEKEREK